MHRLLIVSAGISLTWVLLLMSGCAGLGAQPLNKAEVVSTAGAKVTLFYGGSREASAVFCPGETVPVYRQESRERLTYTEQGKVRITRVVDRNYLEGVVLEGEIKPGYLARKGDLGCLVTAPEPEK